MDEVNNHPDQTAKREIFSSTTALMRKGKIVLLLVREKYQALTIPVNFFYGAILRSGNVSGKLALPLLAMMSNITKSFPKTVPYIAELNTSPTHSLYILMAITSVRSAEFENDNSFFFNSLASTAADSAVSKSTDQKG